MTVKEAIDARRSIRKYQDRDIEPEVLHEVLEAARLAPSAKNMQSWKFIAVTDKALRPAMVEACGGQTSVMEAPVSLVICATEDSVMSCNQHRSSVDCSIAMSFVMLRACELGLGTCWLGHFYADRVKDVLGLPGNYIPVAVTPLGYPAEAGRERNRKAFDEVCEIR
ncbi:MAG: hypothetical protein ABT01_02650 [Clostridium sp. SCN 57-10]|nr:MAG: hypothetical protein ABT01_02650 [Clostridium sp. SCN 57-10]